MSALVDAVAATPAWWWEVVVLSVWLEDHLYVCWRRRRHAQRARS